MAKVGPRFLLEAVSKKQTERLIKAIGVRDINALRSLIKRALTRLSRVFNTRGGSWHPVLHGFDVNTLASR